MNTSKRAEPEIQGRSFYFGPAGLLHTLVAPAGLFILPHPSGINKHEKDTR